MGNALGSGRVPWEDAPSELVLHVLQFLTWPDRARVAEVARATAAFAASSEYWRWACWRLTVEDCVFTPLHQQDQDWREVFLQAYMLRRRWNRLINGMPLAGPDSDDGSDSDDEGVDSTRIQVCARFRPVSGRGAVQAQEVRVVVPLYQRLQMIRKQHNCTPEEARRLLWGKPGAGEASASWDPWAAAHVSEPTDTVEPAAAAAGAAATGGGDEGGDERPGQMRAKAGVISISPTAAIMCCPSLGLRKFRFHRVFDCTSTQTEVFDVTARPLVSEFINGQSCTLFCYGQTGSGKTHTMFGESPTSVSAPRPNTGLVARVCNEVLAAAATRRASGFDTELRVSYVEVFGDRILDLLQQSQEVGAWHGVAARFVAEGNVAVTVRAAGEIEELLRRGEVSKRKAATAMNEESSRAHTILFLQLKQTMRSSQLSVTSTLCMADLGGSEQVDQSGVTGERLTEAVNINQGLFALQKCILALSRRKPHVPYAASQLTQLLRTVLTGKTMVVVTGSMESSHVAQTISALRFGERCQRIETQGAAAVPISDEAIGLINENLARLERMIKEKETWRTERVVRVDEYTGEQEVLLKTVPTGADDLRAEYERLLDTRARLLGTAVPPPPK